VLTGRAVVVDKNHAYALLVPITLPAPGVKGEASRLTGILALGPRLSGEGYSREEMAMLLTLADQAGTMVEAMRR